MQRWEGSFVANVVHQEEDDDKFPRQHQREKPENYTGTAIFHGNQQSKTSTQQQSQSHSTQSANRSFQPSSEIPRNVNIQCDHCRRLISTPANNSILETRSAHVSDET